MATKYWLGTATAVAQVSTVQITAYDASTDYTITIGGVSVTVDGTTDADGTASALSTAFNNSTHPYFTGITASVATDTVTLTADTAGVPFVASSSVTGGTGTIGSVTESTASAGPSHWDTADNWSDGSVPGTNDTVIFADNAVNCVYGIDNNSLAINDLFIEQTYTGKIGLDRNVFATSADGETTDSTKAEYREDFLRVDVDTLEIGKFTGIGTSVGSTRLKIDNTNTGANTTRIFATANAGSETNLPPVRLKYNSTTADVFIRGGSVGIGVDEPAESVSMGDLYVSGANTKVFLGTGTSVVTVVQKNGKSLIQSTATVTSITLNGGTLTTEGTFTLTTGTVENGTFYPNHNSGSNAITTLNINGGVVDATQTSEPRTWATTNINIGGTLTINTNLVTMTTFNDPTGLYTMTVG